MNPIEQAYREGIAEQGPQWRLQRTAELYLAGRQLIESRVRQEHPDLRGEALNRAIARKMYRNDPEAIKLLDRYESSLSE